jgi:malate dehydrogenase (oxaloacetate-decarboxylating)(NADP+)
MRSMILRARQANLRVVFSSGTSETVLRACGVLVDEGIARPILLGPEDEVERATERLHVDLGSVPVIDPARSPKLEAYAEEYFRMRSRRGVLRDAASRRLCQPDYYAAMMVLSGDADMMIAGVAHHYVESLRMLIEVIGPAPGTRRVSSHYLVLLPDRPVLLADCAINIEPEAEDLAETALLASRMARALGIEPRVAMLSFSNFGSVDHPAAVRMRRATEIAQERAPELVIDGEMQLSTALDGALRREHFGFSRLQENANVLVFPDLQSGTLALQLLERLGTAVPIGPILMGARAPAHLVQYGFTVEQVVNLTTVGAVEAAAQARTG